MFTAIITIPEIVQSYCYLYHPSQFCWSIRETTFHLVTFYGKPLFVWNFYPTVEGPLTKCVAFVHHWMTLDCNRFHRTGYSQSLWETIQPHHSNMLPVLLHYLGSYSVFETHFVLFINSLRSFIVINYTHHL